MTRKKQNTKVLMQQKRRRRELLTFWRILKYGAHSFLRNAWLSVAATAIMTITLVIIFGSFAAKNLLSDTIGVFEDKIDSSIYLKRETSEKDILKISESLKNLKSVESVSHKEPTRAREEFARENYDDEKIKEALGEAEDVFGWIINVKPVDPRKFDEIKNFVASDKLIQEKISPDHEPSFNSGRQVAINNIANAMAFAEKIGLVIGVIFAIVASLIIFNTIRMAIFNRREEIYMMKLIGANKGFISGPFLVESVICGCLSALIATGVSYGVIFSVKSRLELAGVPMSGTVSILQNYVILILIAMMALGSFIGIFSSEIATRKYLKI